MLREWTWLALRRLPRKVLHECEEPSPPCEPSPVRCLAALQAPISSSTKKRSVSSARKWMFALRLSINCELTEDCAATSRSADSASDASRSTTSRTSAHVVAGSSDASRQKLKRQESLARAMTEYREKDSVSRPHTPSHQKEPDGF